MDGIPLSRPKKSISRDFADGGEPTRPHESVFVSTQELTCLEFVSFTTSKITYVLTARAVYDEKRGCWNIGFCARNVLITDSQSVGHQLQ